MDEKKLYPVKHAIGPDALMMQNANIPHDVIEQMKRSGVIAAVNEQNGGGGEKRWITAEVLARFCLRQAQRQWQL